MSKRKPHRSHVGTLVTPLLGLLCLGGAVAYTTVVGSSLATVSNQSAPEEFDAVGIIRHETSAPSGVLRVSVDDGAGGEESYEQTLICRGSLPNDPLACAVLGEIEDPFGGAAPDATCTDVNYGPQVAVITGHWNGTEIEAEVTREGSCEEARWQRLRPLLDPMD